MKNGGLEAQRTPDLLFWLLFAIGTEGEIIPNRIESMIFKGKTYRLNPTEVVLSSLVSCLELIWYSRSEEMSETDISVHFQRICNVSDALFTKLHFMTAMMMDRSGSDLTSKRHLWKHAPEMYRTIGSPKNNDCDLPENGHIVDKQMFNRTSKRYGSNMEELCNMVLNNYHLCNRTLPYVTLCFLMRPYVSLCCFMFPYVHYCFIFHFIILFLKVSCLLHI
jgi:hypothetical protein